MSRFCNNCGFENKDSNNFCENCGTKLEGNNNQDTQSNDTVSSDKKKNKKYISPKDNKYANFLTIISAVLIEGLFILDKIVEKITGNENATLIAIWGLMIPVGIMILLFVRIKYPANKLSKIVLIFSILLYIALVCWWIYIIETCLHTPIDCSRLEILFP